MKMIRTVCLLNCVQAFCSHFILDWPSIIDFACAVLGILSLMATVIFCTMMNRLAVAYRLRQSARSWLTTRVLVMIIWVVPMGILNALSLLSTITGGSFHWNMGIFVIPVLFIFVVPLIHLFVSTSRMRKEAESSGAHGNDLNYGS